MLALRLPPDIEKRLDDLARQTGRTKSFYAREALIEHLDDLEDLYLARDLGEALAGPLSGYWKYRVGDYRVIAKIEDRQLIVLVVRIGNLRDVYR